MAYTQAQLDALRSAVASGARRVKMNGEEVEYRSLAEMQRLIGAIEANLSVTARPRVGVVYYERD